MSRAPSALLAAALALAAGACERGTSGNVGRAAADGGLAPITSPAPPFSADSAYALLRRQVEFGPRVPGSPGHQAQLAWMMSYLKARADTLVVQAFPATAPNGDHLQLTNLIARFRPQAADRILLLAHWDTRPTADNEADSLARKRPILGANDGASGVAVLMQLADVLKHHSPPIGVDLLFVDGEDYTGDMYLGSQHFAATWGPTYHPLYGILLDMVGDQHPQFPVEPNSQQYAPEVVQRVYDLAEQLGLSSYFPRSPGIEILDDHLPLNQAGIHTIDIIDFDYGPNNAYWHTLQDDLAHTSPEGLGVVGRLVAALIYLGG
jgi:glutaminyl-peptide cyclotransferase